MLTLFGCTFVPIVKTSRGARGYTNATYRRGYVRFYGRRLCISKSLDLSAATDKTLVMGRGEDIVGVGRYAPRESGIKKDAMLVICSYLT